MLDTTSIEHDLETAVADHRCGEIEKGGDLYRKVIAVHPDNADAWHRHANGKRPQQIEIIDDFQKNETG